MVNSQKKKKERILSTVRIRKKGIPCRVNSIGKSDRASVGPAT